MNFDHWKEAECIANETPVSGPAPLDTMTAKETRRAGARRSGARPIPVDRAFTKFPTGGRVAGQRRAKSVTILVQAASERSGQVNSHFIASDRGPDMDLALVERVEGVTETV